MDSIETVSAAQGIRQAWAIDSVGAMAAAFAEEKRRVDTRLAAQAADAHMQTQLTNALQRLAPQLKL